MAGTTTAGTTTAAMTTAATASAAMSTAVDTISAAMTKATETAVARWAPGPARLPSTTGRILRLPTINTGTRVAAARVVASGSHTSMR